ncbi:MAG TPA: nucleotidyltransferase family protein [Rhodocyclaceae bacterium]|nr:nucleotidyltransferase family protein [Rhodocyclaceae bacterium]
MKIDALLRLMRDTSEATKLTLGDWDQIIRLARIANVLARLAEDLAVAGLLDEVPQAPRDHLVAARVLGRRQRMAGLTEIERVRDALSASELPTVLLKGGAYLAANLPLSRGRMFGDIDLLFRREDLPEAESTLILHGWNSGAVSDYDQRYYRQWMHELPPLTHLKRHSVLDVHHNILPATARHPPDAKLLLEQAQELPDMPGVFVLCPADMVLHSACHLFHEGELGNGLRDLSDLDRLMRHFGKQDGFWATLTERAGLLHLRRPLCYAVRMCTTMLSTPVPHDVVRELRRFGGVRLPFMDAIYQRALRADHPLADDRWTALARWALYVRAHWLRMPPHLLIAHLARKAWFRWTGFPEYPTSEEEVPVQH